MNWKRRGLRLALVLLLAGGLTYWVGRYAWGTYQYRLAQHAAERHDYALAHERGLASSRVFAQDPDVLAACTAWARRSGRYDEAAGHLRDLQRFPDRRQEAAWEQLLLLAQQGRLAAEDEQRLLALAQARPGYRAEALESLARGYLLNYRLGEAFALVKELCAARPDYAPGYYLRGLLHEGVQDITAALASYQTAVTSQPHYFAARLRLGECHLSRNDPQQAKGEFDRLVADRPDDFAAQLGQARCLRLLGRAEEAEAVLRRLAHTNPDRPAVWQELGGLALAAGRHAEAEGHCRWALERDPHDPNALYALAQSLQHQGRLAEAEEWLRKHQAVKADLDELRRLHQEIGRDPLSAAKRRQAAVVCLRNGQEEEAGRWLTGALQLAPDDRETRRLLTNYYSHQGEPQRAAEHRGQAAP